MQPSSFSEAWKAQQEQLQQKLLRIQEVAGRIASTAETAKNNLGSLCTAANMVSEDLTTGRDAAVLAREALGASDATLLTDNAIISPMHADFVNAQAASLDARFGLDTSTEKLGLAARATNKEQGIMEENGKKVGEDAARFKKMAETADEMLTLLATGRQAIDKG